MENKHGVKRVYQGLYEVYFLNEYIGSSPNEVWAWQVFKQLRDKAMTKEDIPRVMKSILRRKAA